ncbi:choice-of-anchor C family protein [Nitrosopumilus adriaticus]|uniref:choice-of-anchor C family protein n=1 Tax=Nitrosopumilus adriaticus TaxID=1580092 RepID=UPI00352C9303
MTKTILSTIFLSTILLTSLIATAGLQTANATTNLVVNGSFEEDPTSICPTWFVTLSAGSTFLNGWTIAGEDTIDWICTLWEASDGTKSIDLSGTPGKGIVSQDIPTEVGATYDVSFDMAGNPGFCGEPAVKFMKVSVASYENELSFDTTGKSNTDMGWESNTFSFVAESSTSTLSFESLTGTYCGPALDNVSVMESVPQDTTPPTVTVPTISPVEATSPDGATVDFVVTATDIEDGDVTPDCDKTSGDTFPVGTTTVTCSATDTAGNTSADSFFDVTVDLTYQGQKNQQITVLEDLTDTASKKTQKELEKAIKDITKSLDEKLWDSSTTLDAKYGHKVFDKEKSAVKDLLKIQKYNDSVDVSGVIDVLVNVDKQLAQDAINAATIFAGDDKVDKELEKAADEMNKAQEELDDDKPDKAIDKFKKAWKHAQKAIKHATK